MPCSTADREHSLFSIVMFSLKPVRMPQVPFWSQRLLRMMTPLLVTVRMPARGSADDGKALDGHVVGAFQVDAVGRADVRAD